MRPQARSLLLPRLLVAAGIASSSTWAAAQPPYTYSTWERPALLEFSSSPPPPPGQVMPDPDTKARYVWYGDPVTCPSTAAAQRVCDGTDSGPELAELAARLRLPRPGSLPLFVRATISVAADDYFALYVNGRLQTPSGVWHDDTGDRAVTFDIGGALRLGAENVIEVFACDGYKPTDGAAPGATPAGGWDGCPSPTNRVNNWLLIDGEVLVLQGAPDGPAVFRRSLASGQDGLGGWWARAGYLP